MVLFHYTPPSTGSPGAYAELAADTGNPGRRRSPRAAPGLPSTPDAQAGPLRTMWNAYMAVSFYLDLPPVPTALIRRLEDDPALRAVCGFGNELPGRRTFNRFIQPPGRSQLDLVAGCITLP